MKKLVFFTALFCLACVVSGCGSSKKPPHIQLPQYPDAFVAVGAAPVRGGNIRLIRQQAETDGRQGIARMLSTRVQELIKNWGEQNQSSLYDKAAFNDYFESVGRAITNHQLIGSRLVESYYDEKTDTQYAVVIYKREDAAKLAKDQMEKERKKLEEEEHERRMFTSRKEAERAFKELDSLIEKQLGEQM